jgi:hypothetical protein
MLWDTMRVITWNLGYWQHRRSHDEAWAYIREDETIPHRSAHDEVFPLRHDTVHVLNARWRDKRHTVDRAAIRQRPV